MSVVRAGAKPIDPSSIRGLENKRNDLIDKYQSTDVKADTWKRIGVAGLGMAIGGLATGVIIGKASHGSQSTGAVLNQLFGGIMGAGIGAGLGFYAGNSILRPSGADAAAIIAERREKYSAEIKDVDRQLTEADGRRPHGLPDVKDSKPGGPAIGSTARQAGAGLGLGLLGAMVTNSMLGFTPESGKREPLNMILGPVAAGVLGASIIGNLNARSEADGKTGIGDAIRSVAIGAASGAAASLSPGYGQFGSLPQRLAIGAGVGAVFGTFMHTITSSSKDGMLPG